MERFFNKITRAFKFTVNLPTTGALYQTSNRAVSEVCKHVYSDRKQIIVEFGAGYGNITRFILQKMHESSTLYVFEINAEFCDSLRAIEDQRLIVINESAESFALHLNEDIDCIISTLPLTFISKSTILSILYQSVNSLKDGGVMSQILYSTLHLKKYRTFFPNTVFKIIPSLPFEFVYHSLK